MAKIATEYYVNKGINEPNLKFPSTKGSGITLINEEIKGIMEVWLTDQISMSSCLYFVRYWAICVL